MFVKDDKKEGNSSTRQIHFISIALKIDPCFHSNDTAAHVGSWNKVTQRIWESCLSCKAMRVTEQNLITIIID